MSPIAYIGFGSNLGDRERTFALSVEALEGLPSTSLAGHSRLYETEPVGLTDQGPMFLNAVIALSTDLSPRELVERLRGIEQKLGKLAAHRSDLSRHVDLDLLLYGDAVLRDGDLEVPHPRMHDRAFVLVPLAELAANITVAGCGCTVAELVDQLPQEAFDGMRPFTRSSP